MRSWPTPSRLSVAGLNSAAQAIRPRQCRRVEDDRLPRWRRRKGILPGDVRVELELPRGALGSTAGHRLLICGTAFEGLLVARIAVRSRPEILPAGNEYGFEGFVPSQNSRQNFGLVIRQWLA